MQTAFISGCSSGIGEALCEALAKDGWVVYAGVRNLGDVAHLEAKYPGKIRPTVLDVTKPDDIAKSADLVGRECPQGLDLLVCNAGANLNGTFEHTPIEQGSDLVALNFWGPVLLARALLPSMQRAATNNGSSRLVVVASIGAVAAVPWQAYYHASKFAVLGLFESLAYELRPQNIYVTVACPGGVRTRFMEKTRASIEKAMSIIPPNAHPSYSKGMSKLTHLIKTAHRSGSTPKQTAKELLRALSSRHPKFRVVTGMDGKLIFILRTLLTQRAFFQMYLRIFGG